MYKRLLDCKKSNYSKNKFLKEYKQSQIYKSNSCRYPSIDFFRALRISNYHSSLNFSPKRKIKIINNNNFMKKKTKSKNITPYQRLFYSNEINEIKNTKNKFLLEIFNLNMIVQKNIKERFETHFILIQNYFYRSKSYFRLYQKI